MPKYLLTSSFFILFAFTTFAQLNHNDSTKISNELDEELFNILKNQKSSSHFNFTVGIGNKLFSVKNNALNSFQSQVNKLFFTGALNYQNKSGFNLSIMPYVACNKGELKVYQTAVTPGYNLSANNIDLSFSYTRYFADYKAYNSNATYQNDFYTTIKYIKPFLQPSFSLGYTTGRFKEINIDTIKNLNNRIVRDSTNNNIKNFSMSLGLEHSFEFENFLHADGNLSFRPQLLIIAGSEKFAVIHTNKNYNTLINRSKKFKSRTQKLNDAFNLQSLALSLDVTYIIGKFSLSPNIYVDYYMHGTKEKRFTTVYSLTAGISF
jgi:hypothetical protein